MPILRRSVVQFCSAPLVRFHTALDKTGSWKDNVFVERLWKSVKYEEVYLRAYESVPEARTGLGRYFEFYNAGRPHSSLGGMTPDQFFDRAPAESAVA